LPPLPPTRFSIGASGALRGGGAGRNRDYSKYCTRSAGETLPAAVMTGADDGVKKAGDGAEHAHGSTAAAADVSVGDAGAGLAASVSVAGDMAETQSDAAPVFWPSLGTVLRFKTHTEHAFSRRPWKRSLAGSRLPLAESMDHSSNAGVTLDIENNEERSPVAEPCATDVEACPVAVVAPARAITRYSVAPAAEAGDPTRIRTRGWRAATAGSKG